MEDKYREALREIERLKKENAELKHKLDIDGNAQAINDEQAFEKDQKISLFKNIFKGRDDVFALRWEGKDGKTGYSPACANLWHKELCKKPQIKCANCCNKKYRMLTDDEIYKHLTGKQTIGIYPLQKDETCYFLAADFDNETWKQDSTAFYNTCTKHGILPALEISRSGKGAHVWMFFEKAIPARKARELGSGLIAETMDVCRTLGFTSYDRLFPNQDTMPKGGFGNLIALPLQFGPRKDGRTVFVDAGFLPFADQWWFLASLVKIKVMEVDSLIELIGKKDLSIIQESQGKYNDKEKPWISKGTEDANSKVVFPASVKATLSNLVYIEREGLQAKAANRLMRLAAFPNPEFFQAQAMRLSTYVIPRIIHCGQEYPKYIGLPRGCLKEVRQLIENAGSKLIIEDKKEDGSPLSVNFQGNLTSWQQEAAEEILRHETGVLSAATAFGKTVVALKIIAERKVNTLIIVNRRQLMDQWLERLKTFLVLQENMLGQIGGGKDKLSGHIDVAMIQSLSRRNENISVEKYGQIIVDECHHVSAFSFESVMKKAKARYVLGLTATPVRKDGHQPIIFMQCGPIIYTVGAKEAQVESGLLCRVVKRTTDFKADQNDKSTIQSLYRDLALDERRNSLLFDDILKALEQKRSPLVLTERREHLDCLSEKLKDFAKNILVFRGGMGIKQHRELTEKLKVIPANEERLILATGRYIGEGFDDARLDALFITLPIAWKGTLQQYAGRLHRRAADKREVIIYDYVDEQIPVLKRMFAKRLKGYKAMGYEVKDS